MHEYTKSKLPQPADIHANVARLRRSWRRNLGSVYVRWWWYTIRSRSRLRVGELCHDEVAMSFWSSMSLRLLGLILEVGDQVISVLRLLETTKGHLGTRNVLFRVLKVLELNPRSASNRFIHHCSLCPTRVFSSHRTPFCLFASVYEKPST